MIVQHLKSANLSEIVSLSALILTNRNKSSAIKSGQTQSDFKLFLTNVYNSVNKAHKEIKSNIKLSVNVYLSAVDNTVNWPILSIKNGDLNSHINELMRKWQIPFIS